MAARTLTDEDVQALVAAFASVPHITLDPEQHAAQHAFLQAWMAKEQRRAERYEEIKKQVGGWLIITILTGIGLGAYKLGMWIIQHVKVGQ
jgi:hypothetical protein